jgi:hypothetical protein
MKANELRIGNYYDHNGQHKQVTVSVIEEVWNAERTWCKPIPLTEEWLIKMGFVHNFKNIIGCDFFTLYFNSQSKLSVNLNSKKISVIIDGIGNVLTFEYQHVHTLQNLYYALTNEELKITL